MIIVHVMGGLGNQLGQYAFSEKLKTLGKEVKLDFYAYKEAEGDEREWRALELERLEGLEYKACTAAERTVFRDSSMRPLDRVRRKLTGRKDKTVAEEGAYMPEIYGMDDVYLYGFWECERYYAGILPLLRQRIRFPVSGNPKNAEAAKAMEQENSVSLHIRRTDYLTVADGKRYMGICTDAYYDAAMRYIRERVERPVFYIFSDDADYARAHFDRDNMHVVDWNTGEDSLYDMELMRHCRHNICANSTFSIWGARLGVHADKIKVRPLRHDNYETLPVSEVHENWPGWTLIDAAGQLC